MAFFGVTGLGYQDAIRENVRQPEITPQYVFRSGLYRDPLFGQSPAGSKQSDDLCVNATTSSNTAKRAITSHAELQRLKERHATKADHQEFYRRPIVTSADIARWRKDEPLQVNEPWSHVPRKVHRNSEMTKFVDQMALTNPQFSLF